MEEQTKLILLDIILQMFIFVKRNISNENGQIIIEVKLSHEHFITMINLFMITIENVSK